MDEKTVDAQILLTIIQNFYASYLFQYGMVESVLRNSHMNNCTEKFDANDGAMVLVDFINYVAQVNDYDRKFTIKGLYEKYKIQNYKAEMSKLKEFLEKSSQYSERLANGESINDIFNIMAREYNLKNISEDEIYHYTDIVSERVGHSKMHPWTKREVEEKIYAMAYAYEKMANDVKEQSQVAEINKKILEMKKR